MVRKCHSTQSEKCIFVFYRLLFAQVALPCRYMSSGFTGVPFFQRGSVFKRAGGRPCLICPDTKRMLGNLKFTAKYQQIKQLQRLQLMCYALNELSHIVCAKSLTSVIYLSCSMYSLYKCVCEFELATGVCQHHSPSVFFFRTQPSCDAAIDLHTGDSDDGIITGVCPDTTRHAYLHSCEV